MFTPSLAPCDVHGPRPADEPKITFVGHATVLIEVAGLRILTDPLLTDRVMFIRRVADAVPQASWEGLDAVLLSHAHHDHLHLPSLRRIAPGTPVLAPRGSAPVVRRARFDDIIEVTAGDRVELGGATILVIPALHGERRGPLGRRAQPVGYLIESRSWSCYFAGDTDLFSEMSELAGRVSAALLPVWGWGPTLGHGHLDPAGAAAAVDIIKPASVVPIHWGTLWPIGLGGYRRDRLSAPPSELIDSLDGLGIGTEVRVLAPGETIRLASSPVPSPVRR